MKPVLYYSVVDKKLMPDAIKFYFRKQFEKGKHNFSC